MSYAQNKDIARRFVQEIFNDRKIEGAKNFVTPDIIYHGMFEEVRGLEDFKQWMAEDLSAFPDMQVTILDDFGEQNKVAMRWTAKLLMKRTLLTCQPLTRRLRLREPRFCILKQTK